MKRKFITSIFCVFLISISYAQKKPTLIILPSDNWCTQRYFMTSYDNQGVKESVANYHQAFKEDTELGPTISKIGELMTKAGYSLKDAEMELKNLNTRQAEDNVSFSKTSSDRLFESPLDILKRHTKADIIIQIVWNLTNAGGGKVVSFTIEAFDAYTNKRIATVTGTSEPSTAIIPVIIEEAVKSHIKDFDQQLISFAKKQNTFGREIVITIKKWDTWDMNLETEFNNEELLVHIEEWMRKNTVGGNFNLSDASENFAQFEQVMIPLKDSQERDMDARSFARGLQKYLSAAPFKITSKLMIRGLGESILVLGEK